MLRFQGFTDICSLCQDDIEDPFATSNRCLTSSNKKLVETSASLLITGALLISLGGVSGWTGQLRRSVQKPLVAMHFTVIVCRSAGPKPELQGMCMYMPEVHLLHRTDMRYLQQAPQLPSGGVGCQSPGQDAS